MRPPGLLAGVEYAACMESASAVPTMAVVAAPKRKPWATIMCREGFSVTFLRPTQLGLPSEVPTDRREDLRPASLGARR
jgi:hypothetical protein